MSLSPQCHRISFGGAACHTTSHLLGMQVPLADDPSPYDPWTRPIMVDVKCGACDDDDDDDDAREGDAGAGGYSAETKEASPSWNGSVETYDNSARDVFQHYRSSYAAESSGYGAAAAAAAAYANAGAGADAVADADPDADGESSEIFRSCLSEGNSSSSSSNGIDSVTVNSWTSYVPDGSCEFSTLPFFSPPPPSTAYYSLREPSSLDGVDSILESVRKTLEATHVTQGFMYSTTWSGNPYWSRLMSAVSAQVKDEVKGSFLNNVLIGQEPPRFLGAARAGAGGARSLSPRSVCSNAAFAALGMTDMLENVDLASFIDMSKCDALSKGIATAAGSANSFLDPLPFSSLFATTARSALIVDSFTSSCSLSSSAASSFGGGIYLSSGMTGESQRGSGGIREWVYAMKDREASKVFRIMAAFGDKAALSARVGASSSPEDFMTDLGVGSAIPAFQGETFATSLSCRFGVGSVAREHSTAIFEECNDGGKNYYDRLPFRMRLLQSMHDWARPSRVSACVVEGAIGKFDVGGLGFKGYWADVVRDIKGCNSCSRSSSSATTMAVNSKREGKWLSDVVREFEMLLNGSLTRGARGYLQASIDKGVCPEMDDMKEVLESLKLLREVYASYDNEDDDA